MKFVRAPSQYGYAPISQAVFADERLKAEHIGLLCFLLSRPPGWVIYRKHLMSRFSVGRDKMQSLVRHLCDCGYMRLERSRDPETGLWEGTRIAIYDTADAPSAPGTEPAREDDAADAPSDEKSSQHIDEIVESSDSAISDALCAPSVDPQPENPVVGFHPQPEKPSAGFSGCGRVNNDYIINTPLTPQKSGFWPKPIAEQFDQLVEIWKPEPTEALETARRTFGKASDADRAAAAQFAQVVLDDFAKRQRRRPSLRNYLREKLFEPWASGRALEKPKGGPVFVLFDSPAWLAWEADWRKKNGRPASMRMFSVEKTFPDGKKRRGRDFPSLFPPKSPLDLKETGPPNGGTSLVASGPASSVNARAFAD